MPPDARPTLLYDDGCRLCRAFAWLVVRWDRAGRLDVLPWSHPVARDALRTVDPVLRDRSMHFLDADGRLHSLDSAVARVPLALPGCGWLGRTALARPAVRRGLWRAYAAFAARRERLSRVTPDCTAVTRVSG